MCHSLELTVDGFSLHVGFIKVFVTGKVVEDVSALSASVFFFCAALLQKPPFS